METDGNSGSEIPGKRYRIVVQVENCFHQTTGSFIRVVTLTNTLCRCIIYLFLQSEMETVVLNNGMVMPALGLGYGISLSFYL